MKNWRGQEPHPIDDYDFWKNSREENEKFRTIYDSITQNLDAERVKQLRELIDWCIANAVNEEIYNQGDC